MFGNPSQSFFRDTIRNGEGTSLKGGHKKHNMVERWPLSSGGADVREAGIRSSTAFGGRKRAAKLVPQDRFQRSAGADLTEREMGGLDIRRVRQAGNIRSVLPETRQQKTNLNRWWLLAAVARRR